MHKSIFLFTLVLSLITGLLLLTFGCNDKPDVEQSSAETGAVEEFPTSNTPKELLEKVKIKVTVLDETDNQPVTAATVVLYFFTTEDVKSPKYRQMSTNLEGVAEFEFPSLSRAAVRSEFNDHNIPIDLSGKEEVEVTLKVKSQFTLSGFVKDLEGNGLKGAQVFVTRHKPQVNRTDKIIPIPGAGVNIQDFKRRFSFDMEAETKTDENGAFACQLKTRQPVILCAYLNNKVCPHWINCYFQRETGDFETTTLSLYEAQPIDFFLYDTKNQILPNQPLGIIETQDSARRSPDVDRINAVFKMVKISDAQGRVQCNLPIGIEMAVNNKLLFHHPKEGAAFPDPIYSTPLSTFKIEADGNNRFAVIPPGSVRLTGIVTDEEENPLADVKVVLPMNSFISDKQGKFSLIIPFNLHNPVQFNAAKTGYLSKVGRLPDPAMGANEIQAKIQLKKGIRLLVKTGPEVEKVWLIMHQDPQDSPVKEIEGFDLLHNVGNMKVGEFSQPGVYSFSGLMPANLSLLAQKGDGALIMKDGIVIKFSDGLEQTIDISADTGTVAFNAIKKGRLEGQVIVPNSIKPNSISITLMRNDMDGVRIWDPFRLGKAKLSSKKTYANMDGKFFFPDLAYGRYALAATLTEWDQRVDIYSEIEINKETNTIQLVSAAPNEEGGIELSVMNSQLKPMGGVGLYLLDPVDSPLGLPGRLDPLIYTNKDGKIICAPLIPGRYSFTLTQPTGQGYLLDGQINVKKDGVTKAKVVLK